MAEGQPTEVDWSRWLVRAALGGMVAGSVFLAVTMWFATSVGDPAKGTLLMISTIVMGDDAMMNGTASVGVGLAIHVGLSALFGLVFALLASRLTTNGSVATAGLLYGAALYLLNFKVLTPLAFPVFKMANQPFELVVHIVFGTLLGLVLFTLPNPSAATSREGAGARDALQVGAQSR